MVWWIAGLLGILMGRPAGAQVCSYMGLDPMGNTFLVVTAPSQSRSEGSAICRVSGQDAGLDLFYGTYNLFYTDSFSQTIASYNLWDLITHCSISTGDMVWMAGPTSSLDLCPAYTINPYGALVSYVQCTTDSDSVVGFLCQSRPATDLTLTSTLTSTVITDVTATTTTTDVTITTEIIFPVSRTTRTITSTILSSVSTFYTTTLTSSVRFTSSRTTSTTSTSVSVSVSGTTTSRTITSATETTTTRTVTISSATTTTDTLFTCNSSEDLPTTTITI